MYQKFGKRLFDLIFGIILFFLTLPIFFILTFILGIQTKGNPFFVHYRPGLNEKPIKVIKFRTMNNKRDKNNKLLSDNNRITGIGKLIRRLSLDELPQLFNILLGNMSLVGPRPLLLEYLPLYSDEQKIRHTVKPGITGWAQVNGRNRTSWSKRFELDLYYVRNLSFILDCKILFLTVYKVFSRQGINYAEDTTMPPFNGNN